MADYGIFRTNDAKRIAAATRRVEGTPRNYLHVPQQIPNRIGAKTADTDLAGFPPGTESCTCSNCVEGETLADVDPGTAPCCTAALRWKMLDPITGDERELEYLGDSTWGTDPFLGEFSDCTPQNEFVWVIAASLVPHETTLKLTLKTDNNGDCDAPCITYRCAKPFNCKCDNEFYLDSFDGLRPDQLYCNVCVQPVAITDGLTASCATCHATPPVLWQVEFSGVTASGPPTWSGASSLSDTFECSSDCAAWVNQTHYIPASTTPGSSCFWRRAVPAAIVDIEQDPDNNNSQTFHCFGYLDLVINGAGSDGVVLTAYSYSGCWKGVFGDYEGGISWKGGVTGSCDEPIVLTLAMPFAGDQDDYCFPCTGWPDTVTVTPLGAIPLPTSSGRCEPCEIPAAPVDSDPGGCCFEGGCYDLWDSAMCSSFGGTWMSSGCEDSCELEGPCCIGGTCITADGYVCQTLLGGTLVGGDCDDGVCNEGACCSAATGTCSEVPESSCASPDYFWGAGTECTPDPCPDLGACCQSVTDGSQTCGLFIDCECVLVPQVDCLATYGGDGTFCDGTSTGGSCECQGASNCDFTGP